MPSFQHVINKSVLQNLRDILQSCTFGVYLILRARLTWDQPRYNGSVVTGDSWLLYWTV